MNERVQLAIIGVVGLCGIMLCGAIGYGAIVGNAIDVSASTIASGAISGLVGFLARGIVDKPTEPFEVVAPKGNPLEVTETAPTGEQKT